METSVQKVTHQWRQTLIAHSFSMGKMVIFYVQTQFVLAREVCCTLSTHHSGSLLTCLFEPGKNFPSEYPAWFHKKLFISHRWPDFCSTNQSTLASVEWNSLLKGRHSAENDPVLRTRPQYMAWCTILRVFVYPQLDFLQSVHAKSEWRVQLSPSEREKNRPTPSAVKRHKTPKIKFGRSSCWKPRCWLKRPC